MLERPPPPRFRRLVSVGLSLLLLAGVSSPAWGEDENETTIELTEDYPESGVSFYEKTKVKAHCKLDKMICDCSIQYDLKPYTFRYANYAECFIRHNLQPYTDGNLYIECRKEFLSPDIGDKVGGARLAYGRGTIYTTACGLYPTMSLKFKDRINPFIFGKSVTPVSVQATAGQSSVKDLRIQNHKPLVSLLLKDVTTDIFSFTPEIL